LESTYFEDLTIQGYGPAWQWGVGDFIA